MNTPKCATSTSSQSPLSCASRPFGSPPAKGRKRLTAADPDWQQRAEACTSRVAVRWGGVDGKADVGGRFTRASVGGRANAPSQLYAHCEVLAVGLDGQPELR